MNILRLGVLMGAVAGIWLAGIGRDALSATRWSECCGMSRWPMGPEMMWNGSGPMPRHHLAMMWGIPRPYKSMSNPLPLTRKTVKRGAAVYTQNCASCHGTTGVGDGEAGKTLSPPPGNLAWLSQLPMVQWDPFMYWTVAEGGAPLGTAMPAFKDTLSADDIWAVISYIQAQLPESGDAQSPK